MIGREGPYDCETSRFRHFLENRLIDGGEVVSLTRWKPLTRCKITVLISVRGWVDWRAIMQLEGLGELKYPMTYWESNPWSCGLQHSTTSNDLHTRFKDFGKLAQKLIIRVRDTQKDWRRRVLRTHITTADSNGSRTQIPWMNSQATDDLETLSIGTPWGWTHILAYLSCPVSATSPIYPHISVLSIVRNFSHISSHICAVHRPQLLPYILTYLCCPLSATSPIYPCISVLSTVRNFSYISSHICAVQCQQFLPYLFAYLCYPLSAASPTYPRISVLPPVYQPSENSVRNLIIRYISLRTINFLCFLPSSFPVLYDIKWCI
jgi:hypothetical protein